MESRQKHSGRLQASLQGDSTTMPITRFEDLPDASRVWVYGASRDLKGPEAETLLRATDAFLESWKAHGAPLTSALDWRDGRFLTIAVDQRQEGASGCSIDGLFRTLKGLESQLGVGLVTSGLVYFRDGTGAIQAVSRDEFTRLGAAGEVTVDTEVFDLSVTSLGEWRGRFKSRAADSWHGSLIHERV